MTKLTIRDIKLIQCKMKEKRAIISKLTRAIADDELHIQKHCKHPKSYEEVEESYWGGSFEEHAQTSTTPYCSLCGLKGKTTFEEHDYFG